MSIHPFTQLVRDEIRDLIREAVVESDAMRRLALLTTADHWIAALDRRAARGADGQTVQPG
jgi:hypothetical protein